MDEWAQPLRKEEKKPKHLNRLVTAEERPNWKADL